MTVLRPYQQYFSYIRTIEVNTKSYISGRPYQQYFSYIRTIKVNVSLLQSSQVLSQRQDISYFIIWRYFKQTISYQIQVSQSSS